MLLQFQCPARMPQGNPNDRIITEPTPWTRTLDHGLKNLSYRTFFRFVNEKTFDTKNKNPCFVNDHVSPVNDNKQRRARKTKKKRSN